MMRASEQTRNVSPNTQTTSTIATGQLCCHLCHCRPIVDSAIQQVLSEILVAAMLRSNCSRQEHLDVYVTLQNLHSAASLSASTSH